MVVCYVQLSKFRSVFVPIRGLEHAHGLDHAEGHLGDGLSELYGHDGPGVSLNHRQPDFYSKDMGMTGLASARAMARRRPKEYRCKVDAATRCSGVCPHT